jgi:hypothetical protein
MGILHEYLCAWSRRWSAPIFEEVQKDALCRLQGFTPFNPARGTIFDLKMGLKNAYSWCLLGSNQIKKSK